MKAERSLHQKENSGEYAFFSLEKEDFSLQCSALSTRCLFFLPTKVV